MIELPHGFYRRWVMANGGSEMVGLGGTFLLGRWLAPRLGDEMSVAAILLGALAAVALGTLLEGVLVGAAQARVLCTALPRLAPRAWVTASALGAGVAWAVGMLPSTVIALVSASPAASEPHPAEPGRWLQYGLALALGAITGPMLGFAQARVLRHHVVRAARWLPANALAWSLGMLVIFVAMDLLPWSEGGFAPWIGPVLISGVAGAVVGAVHGGILLKLLRDTMASNERVEQNER